MKTIRYILATTLMLFSLSICAQQQHLSKKPESKWNNWAPTSSTGMGLIFRLGYTIGGTTPLPVPAEIRSINSFSPVGGFNVGMEGYRMFGDRWGMSVGIYYAYQGFKTSANVKNYYMSYMDGPNETKGWFTGCNDTKIVTSGLSIPVLATFRISPRWNISFGPYVQFYLTHEFSGSVYCLNSKHHDDGGCTGYLREDTGNGPTGNKVEIHADNPVNYEMSDDMSNVNTGVEVMFDWKVLKHMNAFGKLDWGLTSAFPSDFGTVRFKMFPIYGTIGIAYRY